MTIQPSTSLSLLPRQNSLIQHIRMHLPLRHNPLPIIPFPRRRHHLLRFLNIQRIHTRSHLNLHIFNHFPNIRHVNLRIVIAFTGGTDFLHLTSDRSFQLYHPSHAVVVFRGVATTRYHFNEEARGQFVKRFSGRYLTNLNNMNTIPITACHVLVPLINYLPNEKRPGEQRRRIIHIPKVNGTNGGFTVVKLGINVKHFIRERFHGANV
mmetsp:Transcript_11779/g.14660  ORF Transcript_11779/g.14660 Transcript_11779/m.14660 type:complete len:209 (+) Transcript_11779:163-789(+)